MDSHQIKKNESERVEIESEHAGWMNFHTLKKNRPSSPPLRVAAGSVWQAWLTLQSHCSPASVCPLWTGAGVKTWSFKT